jgi:hypothetical protein
MIYILKQVRLGGIKGEVMNAVLRKDPLPKVSEHLIGEK